MTELRQRQPRVRCPGYLAWLRRQGCCCGCGSSAPSDAAHIRSGSSWYGKDYTGMQEKPDDQWALPLKHSHHMAQHAFGSELEWFSAHGLDPFGLCLKYYYEYLADHGPITDRVARLPKKKKAKGSIAKKSWPKRKFPSQK